MRRLFCLALLWASAGFVSSAQASDWMFQRSYYSHQPATPVEIGRRSAGGPFYSRPQGVYVNGGFRWMRSTISLGGRVYDNVNVYESWVQTGGQF